MLMLPVLVLPFITLLFWALGGGKGSTVQAMPASEGLNPKLPDAQFKEEQEDDLWNKFSLYETAARDSAAYKTARENDPYFDLQTSGSTKNGSEEESKLIGTFRRRDRQLDPNEDKVNSKLEELYREINRPVESRDFVSQNVMSQDMHVHPDTSGDIAALETMMEELHDEEQSIAAEDDMSDINTMLDKLMDVQHPERVRERMNANKQSIKSNPFIVSASDGRTQNSSITSRADSTVNADRSGQRSKQTTIHAIIHETQSLVSGAMVRLRLLTDVTIDQQLFPQDNFLYGICSINGERMMIEINSIVNSVTQMLMPVSLTVHDLDGLEGIYIPGAISRDAAKQASDDALQGVQLMSFDQSLTAQAATAGIEATKSLLSKKAKLVKITVKAGHRVFLLNKQQ